MEIELHYNSLQLDEVVKFISENNGSFTGKTKQIREAILSHMKRLAFQLDSSWSGTMGYLLLVVDRELEGIDDDHNSVTIEIYVDPSLGKKNYTPEEYVKETISGQPGK
jgi:hypothetical protein